MKSSHPALKDEYVAIATFGHKTELKLLLTNNYDDVQQEIGTVHNQPYIIMNVGFIAISSVVHLEISPT